MKSRMRWAGLGLLCVAATAQAQVDLEPFLKRDMISALKISPTGEYYAMTVPMEDRTALSILRRSDRKLTAKVSGVKNSLVDDFWWVNNERLVISMAEKFGSEDQPGLTGELHGINADGSDSRRLFARFGVGGGDPVPMAAFMVDTLRGDDNNVLISVRTFDKNPVTRVEKLDVYTRKRVRVATAPLRGARFASDAAGVVRFAQGADNQNNSKLYYREDDKAEWRLLNDEAQSHRREWPLGLSEDGASAYLQAENNEGTDAIVVMDLASGSRTEKLRDPAVDPYSVIHDRSDWIPIGAFFMHERVQTRFFDNQSKTAKLYRTLEKAFPGNAVHVTSSTADGKLLVFRTWSDTSPGDYYLYDAEDRRADLIFSQRSWFDPEHMAPLRAIELKARDGLTLRGYLTVPKGAEAKNLPMVVVPHGGPYGVFDEWDFDDEAQMLSQAGYAVLRVNFRGSGNYGRSFLGAGAREWGLKMQDDVTDATRWAVAQQIADPRRICIYGASYGGYAALAGVSKEPDLYRCAVGYVGVYDLTMMHRVESRESTSMRNWTADWLGERDSLAAVSPTSNAARIKAPVFLAAGGEDETAPIAHSKRMEKALKSAGVPVETLYFDTEGHGFYTEPHRREFYTKLLDFLSRNLGGAKAK